MKLWKTPDARSRTITFVMVLIVEFALGWYLNVVRYDVQNDALSRVANAFYVLYSRDPHLGAIGFVWNPLPSMTELLEVALWPLFPVLVTNAIAGTILTSLAAAGQTVLIVRQFQKNGLKTWHGVTISLLLLANPFMLLYGANGMSEMMFSFFLVWCTCAFTSWLQTHESRDLLRAGFALSLAFLTRYEAVVFGMAMAVGVYIVARQYGGKQYRRVRVASAPDQFAKKARRRERRWYTESTLLLFLMPSLYAGIMWILANWMIMKDPLYFFHSAYSNLSQASVLHANTAFEAMVGRPRRVFSFIGQRLAFFSLPYVVVMLFRIGRRRFFTWTSLLLTLLVFSIPALQFVLLLRGASYGWLRFFFYPLPLVIAWLPYELSIPARIGKHRRGMRENLKKNLSIFMFSGTLVVTSVALAFAMDNVTLAPEAYDVIHQQWNLPRLETTKRIAQYINQHEPNALILMDSFSTFNVIVNTKHPKHLVITSDRNFKVSLHHPKSHHVQYILVPQPDNVFRFDAVNRAYPHLYANGLTWTKLVKQFPGWRLYKVT